MDDKNHNQGLSSHEAAKQLKKFGPNELNSSKPKSFLKIALDVFKEPMLLMLLACGIIYLFLGDPTESALLLFSVFAMAGLNFYQEKKTEKSLDALRKLSSPRALVIRDGEREVIAGRDVVPDDLIILSEGDRVPADAIVLEAANLSSDESLLTGESVAVNKTSAPKSETTADNQYLVYSGSLIVRGHGLAKVIATGMQTSMGKIGKSLESLETEKTSLQKEITRIVKLMALVGLACCLILFVVYGLTRGDWLHGFLAGLTLAMSALPEEFPIALTIFMTMGAWRLAQNKVLTRRSVVIETLGSATVLCVDKTGTLTENKMSVAAIDTSDGHIDYRPSIQDAKTKEIVRYGVLASQKEPFDPMEMAFLQAGRDLFDHEKNIHQDMELVKEYALEKYSLAVTHVWNNGKGKFMIAAKGAPEAILDLCHIEGTKKDKLLDQVHMMAIEGLRVIGVARGQYHDHDKLPENRHDFDFSFLGFVGLADPVRPGIDRAIKECRDAGIRVVMITGDYPATAQNIAKQIGLLSPGGIVLGSELDEMSPEALGQRVKNVNIFSRVVPEQKLMIVQALKQNHEVVSMTGDGVNDAPALKAAHIGIAMGNRGTDVAREAASIVLLDDNFASIVKGVRLGRRIYSNLQKAMTYIFAFHIPVIGISLIPVLLKWPLILYPIHIVFLELVFDPTCTIAFEAETEEPNTMKKPPRPIGTPIFNSRMIIFSMLQGIAALVVTVLACYFCLHSGFSEDKTRAFTFAVLIATDMSLILVNRSWSQSIITKLRSASNSYLFSIMGVTIAAVLIALNFEIISRFFQFGNLAAFEIILAFVIGSLVAIWFEILKKMKFLKV